MAVWAQSEQRVRAVGLHHHMVVHEGVFGRFTERLHPRSREGEFAAKPGGTPKPMKLPKKRGPSGEKVRATYHERLKTPEGQAHLEKIRGRASGGEWVPYEGTERSRAMTHVWERTAHTPESQKAADEREAKAKAKKARERAEDEAYTRGVAKVDADYRKALGPEGRKLHDEFNAAHKDWADHSSFEYEDWDRREKMENARKALKAHQEKHGVKRAKDPLKPYRHVSEP